MKKTVKKAIFPIAGMATRFLPLSKEQTEKIKILDDKKRGLIQDVKRVLEKKLLPIKGIPRTNFDEDEVFLLISKKENKQNCFQLLFSKSNKDKEQGGKFPLAPTLKLSKPMSFDSEKEIKEINGERLINASFNIKILTKEEK